MYFDIKAFGKRIAELRKMNGLSQAELAEELNMSHSHLSHIEVGDRPCSIDLMLELAQYFHVSLDYLALGKVQDRDHILFVLHNVIQSLEEVEMSL